MTHYQQCNQHSRWAEIIINTPIQYMLYMHKSTDTMNLLSVKTILIILILSLCLSVSVISAQGQVRNKTIYSELLGASQGIGISYDARFNNHASDGFGFRTGLGFGYSYSQFLAFNLSDDKVEYYDQMFRFGVPVEINYLLGKGKSKLETGAGAVLCLDRYTSKTGAEPDNSFGVAPYLSIGYRLVTRNGFLFRAGVLPNYNITEGKLGFYPYLAFGKAF